MMGLFCVMIVTAVLGLHFHWSITNIWKNRQTLSDSLINFQHTHVTSSRRKTSQRPCDLPLALSHT